MPVDAILCLKLHMDDMLVYFIESFFSCLRACIQRKRHSAHTRHHLKASDAASMLYYARAEKNCQPTVCLKQIQHVQVLVYYVFLVSQHDTYIVYRSLFLTSTGWEALTFRHGALQFALSNSSSKARYVSLFFVRALVIANTC
jgi:hypothetical protein